MSIYPFIARTESVMIAVDYKQEVKAALKSIKKDVETVEEEEKVVVQTEKELEEAEKARIQLRKVLRAKTQIRAQKVRNIGEVIWKAERCWNAGQAKLTEEQRAKEKSWTDYGTTEEFKEDCGMVGRTASGYKRFYENYERIKNYWFDKTKDSKFYRPPGNWREYMKQALPKPKQQNNSNRSAANNSSKKKKKQRKRKHKEIASESSDDEYQPTKKKSKKSNNKSRKNTNNNSNKKSNNTSNNKRQSKQIIYPHSNHQGATEIEIIENYGALFDWLHYNKNGKHKNDVFENCARCCRLVNSYEKPGIKMKCCGTNVHGACKVRLQARPVCEFCEYEALDWTLEEVQSAQLLCLGRWHINNEYLIKINHKIGWISEQQIIDLQCQNNAYQWLSKTIKEQYDETQHKFEAIEQKDNGHGIYFAHRIENGLDAFIYRYPGLFA